MTLKIAKLLDTTLPAESVIRKLSVHDPRNKIGEDNLVLKNSCELRGVNDLIEEKMRYFTASSLFYV